MVMDSQSRVTLLRTTLALLVALGISFGIILLISAQPALAIGKLLFGPLRNLRLFGNVIELMIPLMFTGVGVSLMFSARQINLAAEGSFHLGGLTAASAALFLPLPAPFLAAAAILLGGVAGSLVTFTPALLKAKTGANEIVVSLLVNYLVLFLSNYILSYFLLDPRGAMVSHLIPEAAKLGTIIPKTGVHSGLLIALAAVILAYLFLFRSKMGYAVRLTGENQDFARYAGINVNRVMLVTQLLGGLCAGIGGAVQLLGVFRRFSWSSLLGYGWDAIIVTTLARNNPKYVPLAAFFLAYLRIGADIMARSTDVTPDIVAVAQGVIIILIAAEQFLARYRYKMVLRAAERQISQQQQAPPQAAL